MRVVARFVALALSASSIVAAQPAANASRSAQIRLAGVWATASGDLELAGGHGSLATTLTCVEGLGADASVEIFWSRLGLQLGATWQALDFKEDYRIFSGTDSWGGHDEGDENALNLYASPLVHVPLWSRNELLVGPMFGVAIGGDELVGGGLTYGGQAMLELRTGREDLWYTAGVRVTSLPLGGEYDGERISLIQASVGARFQWP